MTWNYRVVRKNGELGIHEAYYDETGRVHSLSLDPVSNTYDTLPELNTDLELMLEGLDDSIINYEDLASE